MVFFPFPSSTAMQSSGAAGTMVNMAPPRAPFWQEQGWPSEAAWKVAGSPAEAYSTYVAKSQSGAELSAFGFDQPSEFVQAPAGTLLSQLQEQRQGASVSPVKPVTDFGESAVDFLREPALDVAEEAGGLAARTLPRMVAGPIGAGLEVADRAGLDVPGFDELESAGRFLGRGAADLYLPTNLKEAALEVTPLGLAGDIADIRRVGEAVGGAVDNLGRSLYEAVEDPTVFRGVTSPNVARVAGGGEPSQDALAPVLDVLRQATREAEDLRPIQDEMFREQRGAQFGIGEDVYEQFAGEGIEATRRAKAEMAGRFERPELSTPRFTYDELKEAFSAINVHPGFHPGQRIRATEALESILVKGELPEPYAFKQLQQVFPGTADEILATVTRPKTGPARGLTGPAEGVAEQVIPPTQPSLMPEPAVEGFQPSFLQGQTDFAGSFPSDTPYSDAIIRQIGEARRNTFQASTRVNHKRTFAQNFINVLRDVPNELRQAVAGLDISNMFRQGIFTVRHLPSFLADTYIAGRAAVDERFAFGYQALLKSKNRHGLFLSDLPGEISYRNIEEAMSRREENFAGSVMSNVLGYKQTGRANTLFLNARRAHVYDLAEQAWDRPSWFNNVLARPKDKEALANYINRTTGRGTLGSIENTWVESVLGFGLFSPKYLLSRPQAFFNLFNFAHPRVQVEAIKDFSATFGATAGLLALANESGLAEVNLDPTESDFGKFKAGPIRVDPWAGFQQLAVAAARVYSGVSDPEEILPIIERFLRSKLAPFPGTAYSFLMKDGRDIIGRQIGIKELASSFMPIFLQSLYEGAQEGLMGESLASMPAEFFGLGAQVYYKADEKINLQLLEDYPDLKDRENKPISTFEEFRQNYPDLADQWRNQHMDLFEAKVETASDKAQEDFALVQEHKAAQEARDELFAIDPVQWRADSSAQSRALGIQRHMLWKDVDFREETRGPLDKYRDMYHGQIELATDPETKIVKWDQVDDWLASQDAETQQFIFESSLEHETELRKQYLRDVREMVPYWNKRDEAWKEIVKDDPYLSEYETVDDALLAITNELVANGQGRTEAQTNAERLLDHEISVARDESYRYLAEHPELIPMLDKYGYYVPAVFRDFARPR